MGLFDVPIIGPAFGLICAMIGVLLVVGLVIAALQSVARLLSELVRVLRTPGGFRRLSGVLMLSVAWGALFFTALGLALFAGATDVEWSRVGWGTALIGTCGGCGCLLYASGSRARTVARRHDS